MALAENTENCLRRALANQAAATEVIGVLEGASSGNLTLGDAENIILGTTTGSKIGTATTQKLGFYNATPVVQPAHADQAAAVAASGGDAPTESEFNAVVTLLNRLRTDLIALGLIKGSA